MPPFMLRSRPFWIVIAWFGSIMPAARAQEPPCPSQNAQPAPATSSATGSTAAAPAESAVTASTAGGQPSGPTAAAGAAAPAGTGSAQPATRVGPINIVSDEAALGVDGNATLKGNVEARQG